MPLHRCLGRSWLFGLCGHSCKCIGLFCGHYCKCVGDFSGHSCKLNGLCEVDTPVILLDSSYESLADSLPPAEAPDIEVDPKVDYEAGHPHQDEGPAAPVLGRVAGVTQPKVQAGPVHQVEDRWPHNVQGQGDAQKSHHLEAPEHHSENVRERVQEWGKEQE